MATKFSVDLQKTGSDFPHYWEECVGSCHAYMGLREDWRRQIKKCHEELGFRYVRFHGIFNDDMSVCFRGAQWGPNPHQLHYSFYNVDTIFDFLLEIGMKPFIELSYMPSALASGEQTCFNYKGNVTPPADYGEWENLIRVFVTHLIERYGRAEVRMWFFEVWNEPNLKFFWQGTQAEYFKLYQSTAKVIKAIDAQLRVGGPASSCNAWIADLVAFCHQTKTPLDFISTHHYPTDDPLWKNNQLTLEEFFKEFGHEYGKYERGILRKMTQKAKFEAGELPLYYTEWNTSGMVPDLLHDEPYSAALVAKTIADNDGLVAGYSFWTFSDLFEEGGQLSAEFHGGFGLQTIHGIPKPTYRLFELLHQLGDYRLAVTQQANDASVSTVEMLATVKETRIALLVYNHNIPGAPIQEEEVEITLPGLPAVKAATLTRIEETSANPKRKWMELGRPEYPKREILEQLYQASVPDRVVLQPEYVDNSCVLRFKIPAHGVIGIVLQTA